VSVDEILGNDVDHSPREGNVDGVEHSPNDDQGVNDDQGSRFFFFFCQSLFVVTFLLRLC